MSGSPNSVRESGPDVPSWAEIARRHAARWTAAIPSSWAAIASGSDWVPFAGTPEGIPSLSIDLDARTRLVAGRPSGATLDERDRAAAELFAGMLRAEHESHRDTAPGAFPAASLMPALIDAAAQGFLAVDESGIIRFANRMAAQIFGYGSAELVGQPVDLLVPLEARQRHDVHRRRYLEAPVTRPMGQGRDLAGRRKDGTPIPLEISLSAVETGHGTLTVVCVTDISVRKNQERLLHSAHDQLQAEKERLRSVLENLPVGVLIAEAPTGRLVYGNRTLERLARHPFRTVGNIAGYAEWVAFRPDGRRYEASEFPLARTVLYGESVQDEEMRVLRGDGTFGWISVNSAPVLNTNGEVVAAVMAVADVSERKAAEESLRSSEALLAMAQRVAKLAPWSEDTRHGLVEWSPGVYEMLGMPVANTPMPRDAFLALVPPEDRELVRSAFDQALRNKSPYHLEHRILHSNGSIRYVREYAEPVFDEHGEVVRMTGAVQDITDVHQLEQELRQSQKMDAIGQLAGGVAHDFNNLLTVIVGHAALALSQVTPAEPVYERLTEICEAGEKAASVTQQLLAFSRKQLLRPRVIDLNQVVQQTHSMLRRLIGENIEIRLLLAPALYPVKVDAGQMVQVMVNLAVNARDAMPAGGILTIATANFESQDGGRSVVLEVTDTGCGMDEKTLSRIFEPFFTTKPPGKGTGLGLSTVYGIVKQSGGEIRASSTPGKGSRFEIRLPMSTEAPEPEPVAPSFESGAGTVLVIEDEEGVRELARATLERCGYSVLAASDGIEALELLGSFPGAVDLILMDVVMPRLGGLDLAGRLEALRPGVPVLFMSGYTSDAVLQRGIADDEVPFLPKPFSPNVLAHKVAELLARRKAGSA